MKNTEVRPESASVRLAAYLESHKDAMTNEWVERVSKDSAVPTDFMTKPEIIDHIPQIFDAIIQASNRFIASGQPFAVRPSPNVARRTSCPFLAVVICEVTGGA